MTFTYDMFCNLLYFKTHRLLTGEHEIIFYPKFISCNSQYK